ncbi:MAG: hypothetical protein AB7V32_08690, partial [Candidatus Berkiella sp.]
PSGDIREQLKQRIANLQDKDAEKFGNAIEKILREHNIKLNRAESIQMMRPIQAFVGQFHVQKIASTISDKDPKRYAALSIAGAGQSEASGFGRFHAKERLNGLSHKTKENNNTVAWHEGNENDPLAHHFVIQSKSSVKDGSEEVEGELNILGSDFEHIVSFYEETMAKGIPVVVNCTDGIDRTGMVMTALMMLHRYNQDLITDGIDFSKLSQAQQQEIILNIVEDLKRDRGPAFLRSTKDVSNAVMMGYTLIAAQKQMKFEAKLEDPTLKAILAKKLEPDALLRELENELPNLKDETAALAHQWRDLVAQRCEANRIFIEANNDSSKKCQEIKEIQKKHKATDEDGSKDSEVKSHADGSPIKINKKDVYAVKDAPVNLFNGLIKEGFDPNMVLKDNKNMFNFAAESLLKNPTAENFQEMAVLLKNGKISAHKAVEETLKKYDMDPRIIGMLLQIKEDKKQGLNAVKKELKDMSPQEKAKLKAQLKHLSDVEGADKKAINQLTRALPSTSVKQVIKHQVLSRLPTAKAKKMQQQQNATAAPLEGQMPQSNVAPPPPPLPQTERQNDENAEKARREMASELFNEGQKQSLEQENIAFLQNALKKYVQLNEGLENTISLEDLYSFNKKIDDLCEHSNPEIQNAAKNIKKIIDTHTPGLIEEIQGYPLPQLAQYVLDQERQTMAADNDAPPTQPQQQAIEDETTAMPSRETFEANEARMQAQTTTSTAQVEEEEEFTPLSQSAAFREAQPQAQAAQSQPQAEQASVSSVAAGQAAASDSARPDNMKENYANAVYEGDFKTLIGQYNYTSSPDVKQNLESRLLRIVNHVIELTKDPDAKVRDAAQAALKHIKNDPTLANHQDLKSKIDALSKQPVIQQETRARSIVFNPLSPSSSAQQRPLDDYIYYKQLHEQLKEVERKLVDFQTNPVPYGPENDENYNNIEAKYDIKEKIAQLDRQNSDFKKRYEAETKPKSESEKKRGSFGSKK